MEIRLDEKQQALFRLELAKRSRSLGTAYLLWALLGAAGAHRYYLRDYPGGGARTATWFGWLLAMSQSVHAGVTPLATGLSWALSLAVVGFMMLDAFAMPRAVREHNNALARELAVRIQAGAPVA